MNKEIEYLSRITFWEWLGYKIMYPPPKRFLLGGGAIIFLIFSIIIGIRLYNQYNAKKHIEAAQEAIQATLAAISEKNLLIEQHENYFIEKERYFQLLEAFNQKYLEKEAEIEDLKGEKAKVINQKFQEGYLETFQPDENTRNILYQIQSVYDFQNKLVKDWETLANQRTEMEAKLKEDSIKNNTVQRKTPYARVKQKSSQKLDKVEQTATIFQEAYDKGKPFQKSQIGTVNYQGIINLLQLLEKVQEKQGAFLTNDMDFKKYYELLEEQYYTEVTNQSVSSNMAYETEPNPAFREWTETESYQDTETYYETESYSGTCDETTYKTTTTIVDGKAVTRQVPVTKSVPCTQTRKVQKTRPVTRTRSVTKDNGEPRTIEVPYTTFSFYYTLKTVKTSGETSNKEFSRSIKLQGTSPSQPSYSYETKEQVGYIVWKEKWNDKIQEGYLKPYLK